MKILVLAIAGIGDSLIATPFIHELRANFPDATIDAMVLWAGARDLYEGNPHINTVRQKNLIKEGAIKSLPFLLSLRRERYDISINTHTLGRIHYRFVARLIGAPIRVSHEYTNFGWLDRLLINRSLPEDYSVHSVENNNRLLTLLGKKPMLAQHDFELFLTDAEIQWAADFIAQHSKQARKRLGIHVGSGTTKNLACKRWPLAHYITLLKRLRAGCPDLAVILFGGPDEEEAHAEIRREVGETLILTPKTKNFRQAAALMRHCDSFLSVDTVLMHLAAAMRVPNQIVIEAPTLNPTNVPWQTSYQVIRNPVVNGRNLDYYRYDGGPIKGTDEELRACMASIRVEEVLSALERSLGGKA